ncbi:g7963 [Coccomyxa elongata]
MLARTPLNVLYRLRDRESLLNRRGTSVGSIRKLYECLAPHAVATDTESFKDYFCKFVGQGEYLVCFDALLHDLIVYRCVGYEGCFRGDFQSLVPGSLQFDSFFKVHYRQLIAQGAESLNKDFCLLAHGEHFLILASSTVPLSSTDAGFPQDSVVQNVPVYASTTFHLVCLEDGTVCDRYSISDDCIHLSNNSGVYLHDDLLAILTIHGQAVHLLQLLSSGRLVKVQQFGRHCWDDDELILSEHAHAERRWRSSQGLPPDDAEPLVRQEQSGAGRSQMQAGPIGDAAPGTGNDAGEDEPEAVPAPAQPMPLMLLQRAASAPGLEEEDGAAGPRGGVLIEGIKHRILAFLFLERYRDGRAPSDGLRRFFYSFDAYATLVIWKVQFLDRSRLLLSMGLRNATQVRSNSAYFLVVYDRESGCVVGFYDNKNEALLALYLQHTPYFHAACMSTPWARYVTPCPTSLHLPDPSHPQSPQPWSQSQVVRRILANVPATAQALCTSPFLDANLFSYDDKLISATLRMRGYTEQPLKFVSRAYPAASRFKVQPLTTPPAQQPGRPLKQLVAHHFHPVLPLVVCLLHTALQPPQITIYFRE